MIRRFRFRTSLAVCALLVTIASACAEDGRPKTVPENPYLTIFAASIDRLRSASETVFDSAGRPDLANTLNDRLKSYRD